MSRSQLVLRGLLTVASLTFLALTLAWSPHPIVVLAIGIVALTVYAAVEPDSGLVTVLLGAQALHWAAAVPVPTTTGAWVALLGAAWSGLVLHLTASLAASLPGPAPVPVPSLRRWARRGAVVAAATVPVWAVALLAGQESARGQVSLTYAAIAAIALLAFATWLLSREDRPRP
ncbi:MULTISPECIES: hypothetical protein [unclassified Phycicoccus]|uniref:hypothetical protein n=1 Tax=unclassified Phycicoccus TaxID=2637926 RepID=UPI0007038516|nr:MULTISPECIES: hypothetical protein [unclassified Phycicoccus]KRF22863.1 hypothetical protein ASG91_15890 [Phycicoccus sp. Soil802]KRF24461.1 hypothetical protein ASG95_07950 [Phycicoccus sp. Soil803]